MEEGRRSGLDSDLGFVASEKYHQVQSSSTGGRTTGMKLHPMGTVWALVGVRGQGFQGRSSRDEVFRVKNETGDIFSPKTAFWGSFSSPPALERQEQ